MGQASVLQALWSMRSALLRVGRKPTRVCLGVDAYAALIRELYNSDMFGNGLLQEFRETGCIWGVLVVLDSPASGGVMDATGIEVEVVR